MIPFKDLMFEAGAHSIGNGGGELASEPYVIHLYNQRMMLKELTLYEAVRGGRDMLSHRENQSALLYHANRNGQYAVFKRQSVD